MHSFAEHHPWPEGAECPEVHPAPESGCTSTYAHRPPREHRARSNRPPPPDAGARCAEPSIPWLQTPSLEADIRPMSRSLHPGSSKHSAAPSLPERQEISWAQSPERQRTLPLDWRSSATVRPSWPAWLPAPSALSGPPSSVRFADRVLFGQSLSQASLPATGRWCRPTAWSVPESAVPEPAGSAFDSRCRYRCQTI